MGAAKKDGTPSYRVNWRLEGATKDPLNAGDVVELAEEKAAPLVSLGVLSPVEAEEA